MATSKVQGTSLFKIINMTEGSKDALKYARRGVSSSKEDVHKAIEKVDKGLVIIRSEVKILDRDTVESLYERMKKEEHKILPFAIDLFCNGKLKNI